MQTLARPCAGTRLVTPGLHARRLRRASSCQLFTVGSCVSNKTSSHTTSGASSSTCARRSRRCVGPRKITMAKTSRRCAVSMTCRTPWRRDRPSMSADCLRPLPGNLSSAVSTSSAASSTSSQSRNAGEVGARADAVDGFRPATLLVGGLNRRVFMARISPSRRTLIQAGEEVVEASHWDICEAGSEVAKEGRLGVGLWLGADWRPNHQAS